MKILVAGAWPYVNAVPHLGNLIGSILSADFFTRYARLKYGKDNVLFVSGSDEHGTPIEIEAKKRSVEPKALTDQAHEYDKKLFSEWEISFDNYSRTESETHKEFVKTFFTKLPKYIKIQDEELPYCEKDALFLPDRFVKGTCPYCGFQDAKGDQCDNCGRLLTPTILKESKCGICGSKPVIRTTKHWLFDLSAFNNAIKDYVTNSTTLSEHVKAVALKWLKEGLKPRTITRDNAWGIPFEYEGAEHKTIYVWFEAVLGYISASIEYFKEKENKDGWKDFWFGKDARSYFFIGKDNIPFHVVLLPAMLMASNDGYNLPTFIPSTEFLQYEGQKFSKSRRVGIWIDEALKLLDVEYWRYMLARIRPEEKDSNFTWTEAKRTINGELNDEIGNYINRVLTMVHTSFKDVVPEISLDKITADDSAFFDIMTEIQSKVAYEFDVGGIRGATEETLRFARRANIYIDKREPWKLMKYLESAKNQEVDNVLNLAVNSVRILAKLLYPIIPKSAQKIYDQLGLGQIENEGWDDKDVLMIKGGHKINTPSPLFKRLEAYFKEDEIELTISEIRKQLSTARPELLR